MKLTFNVEQMTCGMIIGNQFNLGPQHVVIIDEAGKLHGKGSTVNGRLGVKIQQETLQQFQQIQTPLKNHKFQQIACGQDFSIALDREGKIWATGNNVYGILGNQNQKFVDQFQQIPQQFLRTSNRKILSFIKVYIAILFITTGESHCAAIDDQGSLLMWGDNSYQQCGNENQLNSYENNFQAIKPFQDQEDQLRINYVSCGLYHTLALGSDKFVYSFGSNQFSQLGLCSALDDSQNVVIGIPQKIKYFQDKIITSIACGDYHSVAVTIEGYSYSWGRNNCGQLGLGQLISVKNNSKQGLPKVVESILGRGVINVACKNDQTFFYCADTSKSGNQKVNDELFQIWKSKFIKHEDAHAVMVNYEHRNERRLLKVKQQKDQVTEQTKFNQSQQLSSTQNSKIINPDTNKFQIRQSMQNLGNSNVLEIQETQAQSKPKKLIKYEYTAFENDLCEITAFRKQNLDTKKAHYDYVTQFPFQGLEDNTKIDSKQLNREDILKQMLLKNSHSIQNAAPSDIIQENPFVFKMNQLKLQQMVGKDQNEDGQEIEILRVEKNFSLFNKRNHYPYDVIQNPFKIQP
eukprot:403364927